MRLALRTGHCGLKESRVRNFQQRRHGNGARLALHTVHCNLKESRVSDVQQQRHCNGARLALRTVHCGLKENRERFQQRWHYNGACLALHTAHCGLNESRVRNFQQRRDCNGERLALDTVHCGLKESRARFQQRRQFNGAHMVLYHRHRIMVEHDTNSIQATRSSAHVLTANIRPSFWNRRAGLAVSCRSIGKASPPFFRAIRSRQPHKILRPWQRRSVRTRTFQHPVFHLRVFCQQRSEKAHRQDLGVWGR